MKILKVKPFQDRVMVELTETVEKSFIETPDDKKEAPVTGKVLDVGPGKMLEDGRIIPVAVNPGDMVLFGRYGGTDIDLGPGMTYKMLREDEILGLLYEVEEENEFTSDDDAEAV